MPTKAELELSTEEVRALCEKLFRTPGGRTLRIIREVLAEHGVEVSPTSGAAAFRDGPLDEYLKEIQAKSARAQQIAAYSREGLSMSDAASVRLAETVFDTLMQPSAAGLTPEERDTYSKIIARARAGDDRAKYLEAKLAEMERKQTEWQEQREKAKAVMRTAAKKGGITPDTRKLIEQAMGGEAA